MTAARADSRAAHLPTSPTGIRVNQSRRRAAAATNGEPRDHPRHFLSSFSICFLFGVARLAGKPTSKERGARRVT
ncbi:unnamed protein product [Ixodes persulcatus]